VIRHSAIRRTAVARKGAGSSILLLDDGTPVHDSSATKRKILDLAIGAQYRAPILLSRRYSLSGYREPFPQATSHMPQATGDELLFRAYPQLSQPMMSAYTVLEFRAPSSSVTVRTIAALYPLPCAVV